MPANIGSQIITLKFFDPVDSPVVNRLGKEARQLGLYSGGYLTKISDISVSLSTFVCEIGDGTYQVRGETQAAVTIAVSSALPYVILRWTYTGSASVDYIDFLAVALGSIGANDVVVGKCVFAGSTLTGFDYTSRTNPNTMNLFLKAEPTVPASMRLIVRSGRVSYGSSTFDIPVQQSPLFVAPGSLSRIDLLQVNTSGALIVTQGTIAASPVAPDYGKLVTLAEVTLAVGQTTITATSIRDTRAFVSFAQTSISGVLGSWASRSDNTVYQAATDGFVIVSCTVAVAGDMSVYSTGYTDGSNPPTTARGYCSAIHSASHAEGFTRGSFCMPVRKGDYYKAVYSVHYNNGGSGSQTIYWIPLGS